MDVYNTIAGTLAVTSTSDIKKARRFLNGREFVEWNEISKVEPIRPWDGKPNKPLTALNIESINID